jgi:arsenite-transporting ATPase
MLDRLGDVLFEQSDASSVLFEELTQELTTNNGTAQLRLVLPFAEKADIGLKKIGMEVVVRVGTQKRTIVLPQALSAYRPSGARFEDGALNVTFEKETSGDPH